MGNGGGSTLGIRASWGVVAAATLTAWPAVSWADVFDRYELCAAFALPAATDVYDVLADGRLIALVGDQVHVETSVGARTFRMPVTLPDADFPFFGAAFLRVSPDGTRFAVGNNGGASFADFKVGVFDVDTLSGRWFAADHFDAEWFDNRHLAITSGDFGNPSVVTLLDGASPDALHPVNPVVIGNIGGASGGIAFDVSGNLYTGNGFADAGPSGTGATRAFPRADWRAALAAGSVIDFETGGALVVDVLSASPLGFDGEGNLFIGGGDVPPDTDSIALVRFGVVAAALAGSGPADPNDPTQVRRLDPIPENDANFFAANYNTMTRELYVRDFGDDTVHVYRDSTGVPAVSSWGMTVMMLLALSAATLRLRRGARFTMENS